MNNKISAAQTQALVITAALGFEILILPMAVTSMAELAVTLAAGLVLCILALYSNIDIYKSKILCFIYSIKNILGIILVVKILSDAVKGVMLNDTSLYKIIFICVVVSAYAAWQGIETTARVSQMLFWFIVIGTVYVYLMSVPDINLKNIEFKTGFKGIGSGIALGFVVNAAEIILLLKSNIKGEKKNILKGVVFGLLLIAGIYFVIMGKLGIKGINEVRYPFFEIMNTADLPNVFIKRQEGIFISLWIVSALISLFIYFSSAAEFMCAININRKISVIFLMIFVFIFASFYKGEIRAIRTYCFLQIIGGFLTVFLIPLIYVFGRNKVE